MQINMEPGGIIADTMRRLAVHGQTIDPQSHSIERFYLAEAMARQPDDTIDHARFVTILDSESALGRIAVSDTRPTPSKRLFTTVSLMSEAVFAMPNYDNKQPDVLMGRIKSIGIAAHEIYIGHRSPATFSYTADILTSGRVVLNLLAKEYCAYCPDDVDANLTVPELSSKFAMDSLARQIHPKYSIQRTTTMPYRTDTFNGRHDLNATQIAAVRQHLREVFPLPTDEGYDV